MTLIVLTVLATAWLGYFVLWLRERQATQPLRNDSMLNFDRSLESLGAGRAPAGRAPAGSVGEPTRPVTDLVGELFEVPRTPQQALRRRRHVAALLVSLAVVSLLAVPLFGAASLAVHVLADLGLLLFAFGAVRRQQAAAVGMAEVRVLYTARPALSDTVVTPLRRVVNG